MSRRQFTLVGGALALILLVGWVAFELALSGAIANAGQQADRRMALFDRTLEAIIERFHYLPSSVALAAETRAVLAQPDDAALREAANGFLSRLNDNSGAGERVLSIGHIQTADSFEITVSDTGAGIKAGELARVFDPFYSTKDAGRGLGLGLSISCGLIRDIGGAITVESHPGQGAKFIVRLPLVAAVSAGLLAPDQSAPAFSTKGRARQVSHSQSIELDHSRND